MAFDPTTAALDAPASSTFDPSTAEAYEPASKLRRAGDAALALGRGVVGVPEAAVGVADIVTGGRAGKAAERMGVRFKDARQVLTDLQSDDQKAADAEVQKADGFLPTLGAMARNPSTIINSVAESAPSMLGAGAAARGLVKAGVGGITAGAAGEGIVSAGQTAEQVRQESPTGILTAKQAALAAGSGALTGVINKASGQLANKLGIGDVNTALATGKFGPVGAAAIEKGAEKGIARRVAEGVANEGVLQELPQSYQEQVAQNIAQDKPWDEGAAAAGAQGMLVGGLTGGAFGAVAGHPETPTPQPQVSDLSATAQNPDQGGVSVSAPMGGFAPAAEPTSTVPPVAQPSTPTKAQAMGIDATAGPLSNAAAIAVDTGADVITQTQEVEKQKAEAQAKEKAKPGKDGKTPEPEAPAPVRPAPRDPTAPVTGPFTFGIHGAPDATPTPAPTVDSQGAATAEAGGAQVDAGTARGAGADQGPQGSPAIPAAVPEPANGPTGPVTQESSNASQETSRSQEPGQAQPTASGARGVDAGRPADAQDTGRNAEGPQRAPDQPAAATSTSAAPEGKPPAPTRPLDLGAHVAATSPHNDRPEPTQAQKEAGNYKKAHLVMSGLDISIENPEGSTRSGTDPDGKPWSNTMTGHYGYVKRTTGSDGEQQDVYVKPGTPLDYVGPVFVVDQIDPATGKHDEHKSMIGYRSPLEARKAYQSNYAAGWKGLKSIKTMEWDEFKAWVREPGKAVAPAASAASEQTESRSQAAPDPRASAASAAPQSPATVPAGPRTTSSGSPGESPSRKAPDRPSANATPAKPQGGSNLRTAAWEKNPLMSFLAEHGLFHIKGDRKSLKTQFSPDKNPIVSGMKTGPVFRFNGVKDLQELADLAVQDGFLPRGALDDEMTTLIERAMRGDIVRPLYAEGVAETEMEKRIRAIDDMAELRDNEFADLPDEAFWRGNTSTEDAMRALGFTEQEIADDVAQGSRAPQEGSQGRAQPDGSQAAGARAGGEAGATAPSAATAEGLTQPTADELIANANAAKAAEAADSKEQKRLTDKARADSERNEFTLTGSNRQADVAAAAGQQDIFAAPEPKAKPVASANTMFTSEAADAARARLKAKLHSLNSGIDPQTMIDGILLAGYHVERGARTFVAYAKAMIEDLGRGATPYLRSWYMGVKYDPRASGFTNEMDSAAQMELVDLENLDGKPAARQGVEDVPDTSTRVERNSQVASPEPAVGGPVSPGPGDAGGSAVGDRADFGPEGGRPQSDPQLPADGTAAGGERGDLDLFGGKQPVQPALFDAGVDDGERGGDSGITGVPPEHIPAGAVGQAADTGLGERQRAANRVAVEPGLENIRATLPQLLPAQQEDVLKAETRFAKPTSYGMLFTNSTGTGKTFSGLGILKRAERQGKRNILVVVPDDKIAGDWIEAGQLLELPITLLADTKTAGQGVVITSYANLGQNDELASRKWDMVLADEAHSLMSNAQGEVTTYLANFRAITMHPEGAYQRRDMQNREMVNKLRDLNERMDALTKDRAGGHAEEIKRLDAEANPLRAELARKLVEVKAEIEASQGAARTRGVFLSATPFAYEKTLDWANGYLFDYNDDFTGSKDGSRGYNQPGPREDFFMRHLGYRMRYGKLTEPDAAKVDRGLLQRQLNGWMKKQGSLSGRMLDVPADYDRRFVLVDSAVGNKIDDALQYLSDNARETRVNDAQTKAEHPNAGPETLRKAIDDKFDYLSRRFLLEAIKATEVIPIVKAHLALNRKVVVFHDYKKGGGFNPFDIPLARVPVDTLPGELESMQRRVDDFNRARNAFRMKFHDLVGTPFETFPSPIQVFKREIPDVLLVNGDEKKSDLMKRYKLFQDDDSGPQVMLVQSAKNKGWSGHDTTGKHQRVLINLGQPTAPTLAVQQEGRIYRTGQVSDAIMRYLNTGTNWEKWAFATTIAQRASAAENLGTGELARALKDSFIRSFEESDRYPPGHEGEGKGGKEQDKLANGAVTEYDRAKTHYWATQKNTKTKAAREGTDYYATPEPIGLKMVQFLDPRGGEDLLEPSGGHGAIARWMPDTTVRTAIEPSTALRSRMAMVMQDGNYKVIDSDFESHNVVNKYDGIAMNPPFGLGGKTAMEHLHKASTHLRDGGRIVAIIPTGPAADKKFDQWFYEEAERTAKPLMKHPQFGDIYRGDTVTTALPWAKTATVQSTRVDGDVMVRVEGYPHAVGVGPNAITGVKPTGPRKTKYRPAEGLYKVADIKLPGVTFERAGTAVMTRLVVIEKQADAKKPAPQQRSEQDLTGIEDINELFDRMEDMTMPARVKPVETTAEDEKEAKIAAKEAIKAAKAPAAPVGPKATPAAGAKQVTIGGKAYEVTTYTTQSDKVLTGAWIDDGELAKQLDKFTWRNKQTGKFFVRERDFPKQAVATLANTPKYSRASVKVSPPATETPAFKAWFGDSKIVDADGKPLVVYHGTIGDVSAFDPDRAGQEKRSDWGKGIYFTPSPSTADYYRGEAAKRVDTESSRLWELIEAEEKETKWRNGSPSYTEAHGRLLKEWRAARSTAEHRAGSIMPAYLSIQNPLVEGYSRMPDPDLANRARAKGHDGIIVLNGAGGIDEVVAFRPGQIKSAVGNMGTFDGGNPDIRFTRDDTGKPDNLELQRILGRGIAPPAPRTTVAALQAAIRELVGTSLPNALGRVVATTSAEIKSTWEPLIGPVNMGAEGNAGEAQAFFDPSTKTVFLIADQIPKGEETAVLAHELMHKHGVPVLGQAGWDRLHGVIGTWKNAPAGSMERRVYDEAAAKVEAVGADLSNQELFPYAVQAAISMGVKPNAVARQGTVERWLAAVRLALKDVWAKITGKPETFAAQDLVNLAFGIAQRENNPGLSITDQAAAPAPGGGQQFARAAAPTLAQVTQTLKTATQPLGTVNLWDRTVGTQYHKATKDRDFKRVFDAFVQQTDDTAHYAIEAESMAPSILMRIDSVKDALKNLVHSGAQQKADLAAVSKALFANIEGEEGVQSTRYNDDSLRIIFNMTSKQIEMYNQAREAIDTSIERLAQTYAAQMGGDQGMELAQVKDMSLEDTVATVKAFIQAKHDELRVAQTLASDVKAEGETIDKPRAPSKAETTRQLAALDAMEEQTQSLKDAGYTPAMRFGKFAVTVRNADADEVQHFEMFETRWEANLAAARLQREYPASEVTKGVMNPEQYAMFKGVSPETVELFAKFTGADKNEAYQDYIALAKSARSVMKRQLKRKGIAGFSQDATRVMASFITSNARQSAINMNLGEINEALTSKALARKGDVQREAQKLSEYMNNPVEEARRLRGFMFMHFMGGSVASALVNLTQPILQTGPYLHQFAGAKTAGILARSAKMAATGTIEDADLARAAKRAREDGITEPHEIHQLMADAGSSAFGNNLRARAAVKLWGSFFSHSEAFNRRVTFLAAYQVGKDAGKADPYDFARRAVIETQGLYNKANRPNWARGAVGATIFTFKQFSIAYLEWLSRLPRREKVIALAILMLAAGSDGLPFADDIEDLIDTIGQSLGYNTNSKKAKRKFLEETFGQPLGEILNTGVFSQSTVDLSGRLGMGNLLPATAAFKPSETDKAKTIMELAGPVAGILQQFQKALAKAQKGDIIGRSGALSEMAPTAVRNFMQGSDMAATGTYKDTRGYKVADVDALESFAKMLGLQPASIALQSRKFSDELQDKGMTTMMESAIADAWAAGVADKDMEQVAKARETLRTWNEKNPESRIVIKPQQIASRVKKMRETRDQRFLKTVPKENRAQATRELQ